MRFFKEGKAVLLINLAVVACLGWVASLWVGAMISGKMSPPPSRPTRSQTVGRQLMVKTDYSVLLRKNLFNPGGLLSPKASEGEVAPSALPLKLMGTIIAESKKNNVAIIENTTEKRQTLYHVNDLFAPGIAIAEINRFEVLVNNGGKMERLPLDFGEAAAKAALATGKPAGAAQVAALGEGQVIMDRRYFDAQKGNMNTLMTQMRALPNTAKDGSINGFQVFEIVKDSVYDKIGLKNQDVVQRVNGQPLNSVQTGLDLFNALKNDNHFVLDVVRNNENKSIKVDIQ